MAVWPWYGQLAQGELYGAGELLQVQEYCNVRRWTKQLATRLAVQRGFQNRPCRSDAAVLLQALRTINAAVRLRWRVLHPTHPLIGPT